MNYSVFEITPLTASFTYTLPATSTLTTLLQKPGDTQSWIFKNATTTTGVNLTLAKGTGWDLVGIDGNVDVIPGAAEGSQEYLGVSCTRLSSATSTYLTNAKTIVCFLTENLAAD